MNEEQIQLWLDQLREYHGAECVILRFQFDDGQSVVHVSEDPGP
jgi:hypothetical protein